MQLLQKQLCNLCQMQIAMLTIYAIVLLKKQKQFYIPFLFLFTNNTFNSQPNDLHKILKMNSVLLKTKTGRAENSWQHNQTPKVRNPSHKLKIR